MKMIDLLSSLPEELICHILSFLPTKQAVATSVLSKKWKSLWRSVPALNFDDADHNIRRTGAYARFVYSVCTILFARDIPQPMQKFSLRFSSNRHSHRLINAWVSTAVKLRVQHLDLSFRFCSFVELKPPTNLPSIFSCKTLTVLKLQGIKFDRFSSVDLPLLRVLHLQDLSFPGRASLAELLSGCLVLEDFKTNQLCFHECDGIDSEFKTLPKLLRAHIAAESEFFLLGVVNNVKSLQMDDIHRSLSDGTSSCVFPMFHNLIHIKLVYSNYNSNWAEVVEFLKYCPKLQVIVIDQPDIHFCGIDEFKEEVGVWQYPPCVPECILLHFKRCYLNGYIGTKGEFEFAKYVMENARFLQRMTISSGIDKNQRGKRSQLSKKLSSCKRRSATCKFSFN